MQASLLRKELAARGTSISQLAHETQMSRSALSAKINGHRQFTIEEMLKICDALDIKDNRKVADIFLR